MQDGRVEKKRILFVISSLSGGGAEKVFVDLLNRMDPNRYEIFLALFAQEGERLQDLNLAPGKIINLGKRKRSDFFKLILRLRSVIKTLQPRVIFSFLFYTNIVAALAKLLSGCAPQLIMSERNFLPVYLRHTRFGLLKKLLIKIAYPKADIIITNSKGSRKALLDEFGIRKDRVRTICNQLDIDQIRSFCEGAVDHPFFKKGNGAVFISAGRLVKQKRFDILLKAFAALKSKLSSGEVYLIVLGKGEREESLKRLAEHLGIDRQVDFLGYQRNPYLWMKRADVFVLCSDYEGFPNVILEAMACGTPVISTDCPSGPDEIIRNRINGILVRTGDEKVLSEAMHELLRDQNLRRRIAIEGMKSVEDFRVESVIQQYDALLNGEDAAGIQETVPHDAQQV